MYASIPFVVNKYEYISTVKWALQTLSFSAQLLLTKLYAKQRLSPNLD